MKLALRDNKEGFDSTVDHLLMSHVRSSEQYECHSFTLQLDSLFTSQSLHPAVQHPVYLSQIQEGSSVTTCLVTVTVKNITV